MGHDVGRQPRGIGCVGKSETAVALHCGVIASTQLQTNKGCRQLPHWALPSRHCSADKTPLFNLEVRRYFQFD